MLVWHGTAGNVGNSGNLLTDSAATVTHLQPRLNLHCSDRMPAVVLGAACCQCLLDVTSRVHVATAHDGHAATVSHSLLCMHAVRWC